MELKFEIVYNFMFNLFVLGKKDAFNFMKKFDSKE